MTDDTRKALAYDRLLHAIERSYSVLLELHDAATMRGDDYAATAHGLRADILHELLADEGRNPEPCPCRACVLVRKHAAETAEVGQ